MDTRLIPFYEAGIRFEGDAPLTPEQAVEKAGLDWQVELATLYHRPGGPETVALTEWQGVRRTDTDQMLGVVKGTYQPIQNRDAFSFMNVVTESGEAIIRSGGMARGGALSWLYAQVPDTVTLEMDSAEEITVGFMVSNGHDGKRALRATPILIRLMTNTVLSGRALGVSFGLRHAGSMEGKVDEARSALGVTFDSLGRLQGLTNAMVRRTFSPDDVDAVLRRLAPARDEDNVHPKVQERRDMIRAVLYGSPALAGHRSSDNRYVNGWALYAAVCEYADFFAPYRASFRSSEAENRLLSVYAGDAWKLKDKALSLALGGK